MIGGAAAAGSAAERRMSFPPTARSAGSVPSMGSSESGSGSHDSGLLRQLIRWGGTVIKSLAGSAEESRPVHESFADRTSEGRELEVGGDERRSRKRARDVGPALSTTRSNISNKRSGGSDLSLFSASSKISVKRPATQGKVAPEGGGGCLNLAADIFDKILTYLEPVDLASVSESSSEMRGLSLLRSKRHILQHHGAVVQGISRPITNVHCVSCFYQHRSLSLPLTPATAPEPMAVAPGVSVAPVHGGGQQNQVLEEQVPPALLPKEKRRLEQKRRRQYRLELLGHFPEGRPVASYSLGVLQMLKKCGDLLEDQVKQQPRYDYLGLLQCEPLTGKGELITERMRFILVDWMVEVCLEFHLSTAVLHASVALMDRCLGSRTVLKRRLQLLGCVCSMVEGRQALLTSPRAEDRHTASPMSVADVASICGGQYSSEDIEEMVRAVMPLVTSAQSQQPEVGGAAGGATTGGGGGGEAAGIVRAENEGGDETQQPTAAPPVTAAVVLSRYLSHLPEGETGKAASALLVDKGSLTHSASMAAVGRTPGMDESAILTVFLADLTLLDYRLLAFLPSTRATAVLLLARLTTAYYEDSGLLVSSSPLLSAPHPSFVIEPSNREVLSLLGDEEVKPFMNTQDTGKKNPFGLGFLRDFVQHQREEARAVAECMLELWKVHADYLLFISKERMNTKPYVLHAHTHMLKGLQEKYAPADGFRAAAWKKLGQLPEWMLFRAVEEHLLSKARRPQQHQALATAAAAMTT